MRHIKIISVDRFFEINDTNCDRLCWNGSTLCTSIAFHTQHTLCAWMCHLHNCIVIDNGRNGGNNDTVSGRKEKQWNKSHHRGWTNVGGRWTTCWNSCVWVRSGYMVILFVVTDGCCVVTHLFLSDCFATVAVANKTWTWLEKQLTFYQRRFAGRGVKFSDRPLLYTKRPYRRVVHSLLDRRGV